MATMSLTAKQMLPEFNPPRHTTSSSKRLENDNSFSRVFKESILATQIEPELLSTLQLQFGSSESSENTRNPYKIRSQDNADENIFEKLLYFSQVEPQEEVRFEQQSLEEQLTQFLESQQLTKEQCRMRWQLAADLFFILRKHYPSCQLYIFGSLLTGLSDPHSDIDIYMDHQGDGGKFMDQLSPLRQNEKIRKVQDKVADILFAAQCPHNPKAMFAKRVEMLGTRVPIIRFTHRPSEIQCDISFGNRISVQNSKLLKFYLDFDPRVKPLLQFVRYWSDFYELSGSQKIKKYALSLLVLVYLKKKQIVPSINILQILASAQRYNLKITEGISENNDEVDGWDASFCTDLEMISVLFVKNPVPENYPENRTEILFEMCLEFFEMINSIDFTSMAVIPLYGKMVDKDSLIDSRKSLPEKLLALRTKYASERQFCRETRILNPLCILDPFTLDFNVGGLVKRDTMEAFCGASKKTAEILRNGPRSLLKLFLD